MKTNSKNVFKKKKYIWNPPTILFSSSHNLRVPHVLPFLPQIYAFLPQIYALWIAPQSLQHGNTRIQLATFIFACWPRLFLLRAVAAGEAWAAAEEQSDAQLVDGHLAWTRGEQYTWTLQNLVVPGCSSCAATKHTLNTHNYSYSAIYRDHWPYPNKKKLSSAK